MTDTRITFVKRLYGKKDNGEDDPETWLDVERTKALIVERGRGQAYQKTIHEFEWTDDFDDTDKDAEDENGSSDTSTRKRTRKTIKGVDLHVIDELILQRGRGGAYQKTRVKWDNTSANDARKTHTKTIKGDTSVGGTSFGPNSGGDLTTSTDIGGGGGGDGSSLDIEVIEQWTTQRGLRQAFQITKFDVTWHVDDPTGNEDQGN